MNEFEQALLAVLASIDMRLEALVEAGTSMAPNFQRRLADFTAFNWASMGATVLEEDGYGVAAVEWRGSRFTRRAPQNKFDSAIWFSRAVGKDEDGTVRYERLITFKEQAEAEALPDKVRAAVVNGKKTEDRGQRTAATVAVPPAEPVTDGAGTGTRPYVPGTGGTTSTTLPAAGEPVTTTATPQAAAIGLVMRNKALGPEALRRWLAQEAVRWEKRTPASGQVAAVARALAMIVPNDERRHELDGWLTGSSSMKEMPAPMVLALHGWLKPNTKTAEPTNPWAREEIALVLDLMNGEHLQGLAATNPASRFAPEQQEMAADVLPAAGGGR